MTFHEPLAQVSSVDVELTNATCPAVDALHAGSVAAVVTVSAMV